MGPFGRLLIRLASDNRTQQKYPELDPEIAELLPLITNMPGHKVPPKLLRVMYRRLCRMFNMRPVTGVACDDIDYTGGKLRCYLPCHHPHAALVYFHGGGLVIGDLDTHDTWCRYIAKTTQMLVISVDYPLAPEVKFPGNIEGAIAGYNQALRVADKLGVPLQEVGVGGDSAGGYLAISVCLQHSNPELNIAPEHAPAWQWLIYPMVDISRYYPSVAEYGEGLLLTEPLMRYFLSQFLQEMQHGKSALASPLLSERLADLPPTALITVGHDPLTESVEEFKRRLQVCGVPTEHLHLDSLLHDFILFLGRSGAARSGADKAIDVLSQLVWSDSNGNSMTNLAPPAGDSSA